MKKTVFIAGISSEACEELHPLPDGWTFNGDVERPTFTPSFKHEWDQGPLDPRRKPGHHICHYVVTDGRVAYCGDCTHALAGQTIDMPPLPEEFTD
jgi:hypothetical protein